MRYLIVILILFASHMVFAQEVPGIEDINVNDTLAESQNTVDSLPDTLDPDLIPAETATQLFGYIKWIFSENSARELAGNTLAPIFINLYVYLVLGFSFAVIWLILMLAVFTWRFVLFIIRWIIRLIELIPGF